MLAAAIAAAPLARTALAQPAQTPARDRARLAELTGETAARDTLREPVLLRFAMPSAPSGSVARISLVRPHGWLTWNSALPYTINDGAMWAGRGLNASIAGGVGATLPLRQATVRLVLAPGLHFSENAPFQTFASTAGGSAYANPFHDRPGFQLDLPHRFGDRYLLRVDPGFSSASVAWPRVTGGVTTANEWWGPGIRNAIVMSSNAAGIPRLFVRNTHPVRTRAGSLEAQLITGTLTQSLFSRSDTAYRSMSGVLLQLVPAFDTTLRIGLARVVYAPVASGGPMTAALTRSLDVLTRWEHLDGAGTNQGSDQIAAVFARWIVPTARLELYGEYARMDLPHSADELIVAAHHTGGWTFGAQWAQPYRAGNWLRVQSELTYLEQSRVFADRPSPDFYSGMASPQGYTQRGQVIGAAIGPGASSQWLAVDWFARSWQVGTFVGRVRWDNDALYRRVGPTFFDHDVSFLGGVRGSWSTPWTDFATELTWARRYNYLFQNARVRPGNVRTVDVQNVTVTLSATPR